MSNNAPDYENDLVFPPKSADDLNEQRRQSDVLIGAIDKCEKLEQEVKQLRALLREFRDLFNKNAFLTASFKVEFTKDFWKENITKIDEVLK